MIVKTEGIKPEGSVKIVFCFYFKLKIFTAAILDYGKCSGEMTQKCYIKYEIATKTQLLIEWCAYFYL